MTYDRDKTAAQILEYIRSEIQDKDIVFDLKTPIEGVKIDSIDVIHVIFKVEEVFGVAVNLPQDQKYDTVGDFVNAILKFIPIEGKAS